MSIRAGEIIPQVIFLISLFTLALCSQALWSYLFHGKNYPLRIIVYLTLWAVIWAGWRKGQIPFYFHSPGIFHRLMGWVLEVTAQNLNKWVSERNWASTSLCHQSCQPLARCHWLPCCLVCLNKPAAFPFFVDLTDHWQFFHKLLISDHLETCYFFISLHSCTESFFFLVALMAWRCLCFLFWWPWVL